uniref:Uncharacterized protein n=1 Tax=Siphoviridae sp. ctEBu1 TaxID=2825393 RepID=A0A8S5QFU3_9CAUD|nr:MAG TPA: hypothetical protein [Siphoviridae sp. ctEBu1]DAM96428.1 MAG TPA: hypothetical protein [Bacteriophage sp.]
MLFNRKETPHTWRNKLAWRNTIRPERRCFHGQIDQ